MNVDPVYPRCPDCGCDQHFLPCQVVVTKSRQGYGLGVREYCGCLTRPVVP